MWLFIYSIKTKQDNPAFKELHEGLVSPFSGWLGVIVSSAFMIIIMLYMSFDITITNIKRYSTKNMEIVRPYIGETPYLTLRSNYLSMKNEKDFNAFLESLYQAASKSSLDIKKYEAK